MRRLVTNGWPFILLVIVAASSCGGRQLLVSGQCPRSASSASEDPVEVLASAYFRSRGAFAELEGIPRFGPLRVSAGQAAEIITVSRGLAEQVVEAHRIAVLEGFEEASERLLLAVADLWRAIGAAEAATSSRTLGQAELEALSTLIEVSIVVTEDLYDTLDAAVAARLAGEPRTDADLLCLQARFRAFEQWARHLDVLEEESLNLTDEAAIVEDAGDDEEFLVELREQRRLISLHRGASRRALTMLADRGASLDGMTSALEELEGLETVSLDEVASVTQRARGACP